MLFNDNVRRRFLAFVRQDRSGCWRWKGYCDKDGYARFSVDSTHCYRAARFGYEMFVGPIPEGLTLDHVRERGCQYRDCVNPDHLEPVTAEENNIRAGRHSRNAMKTHCVNDHEFTPENTYMRRYKDRYHRMCKECSRARKRANNGSVAQR